MQQKDIDVTTAQLPMVNPTAVLKNMQRDICYLHDTLSAKLPLSSAHM